MAQLKMHVFQPQQHSLLSVYLPFLTLASQKGNYSWRVIVFDIAEETHNIWHSCQYSEWIKKAVRDSFVGDNSQLLLVFSNVEKKKLVYHLMTKGQTNLTSCSNSSGSSGDLIWWWAGWGPPGRPSAGTCESWWGGTPCPDHYDPVASNHSPCLPKGSHLKTHTHFGKSVCILHWYFFINKYWTGSYPKVQRTGSQS